ncbi:hypothetical protein PIB30_075734 [Stylosanthes scabra]|uniref:Uncharacterized protein n=1 Tax=Stylosanthes scabra TaxID=79078 RepID=A0ABU6RQF5_9FABA|nr:hypothetical protein [Stylosanthes scabra]
MVLSWKAMPTFQDYHGDSSSSTSPWDQIQASPNSITIPYQPTIPNQIAEIQHSTIDPESKIVEIIDLHEGVDNTNLELAKERRNQPPPKPPDLRLHKVGDVDVIGIEASAEVGASVRGMWTAMTVDGGTRP